MASFCFLREHGRTAKMPFANERVAVSKNADEDLALMACGIIALPVSSWAAFLCNHLLFALENDGDTLCFSGPQDNRTTHSSRYCRCPCSAVSLRDGKVEFNLSRAVNRCLPLIFCAFMRQC
jgi:hypothetical protein